MDSHRVPSNIRENEVLSALSRHMYIKHRNIFIGIGIVVVSALTSFVVLRNNSHKNRDHLSSIRREIQSVTPGTDSVFELYHAKIKQRQLDKEKSQEQSEKQ